MFDFETPIPQANSFWLSSTNSFMLGPSTRDPCWDSRKERMMRHNLNFNSKPKLNSQNVTFRVQIGCQVEAATRHSGSTYLFGLPLFLPTVYIVHNTRFLPLDRQNRMQSIYSGELRSLTRTAIWQQRFRGIIATLRNAS